ncbi:MAG: biotin transporter BioY [Coriobacteriia bacterium]|nr:biotin transporter BioY [Coriobacteriia bacterium]MCL2536906.1 biotin transporter BioY [Coriobacteriia bacterium]
MFKLSFQTRDLTLIALFVALVAVMAQITIPIPPVPFTMQTFAIIFAGVVLGAKRGFIVALLYLLLGALGAPVFSSFQGGFGHLIGAAGGYLMSFPLLAGLAGLAAHKADKAASLKYLWLVGGIAAAVVVNLSLGTLYLANFLSLGFMAGLAAGFFPFLIPEALKLALVVAIAPKIRAVLEAQARSKESA